MGQRIQRGSVMWGRVSPALWAACVSAAVGFARDAGAQATVQPPQPQAAPSPAPDLAYEGRLIAEIRIEGLVRESQALVLNQIRTQTGTPYTGETVAEDLRRLYRLGRFWRVEASAELRTDGAVTVVYRFEEAPVIEDVAVAGNQRLGNEEIAEVIGLVKGTFVDEHSIDQSRRAIEDLYRRKGYPLAQVTVDEEELREGVVLFRVREGQRVRVTGIRFRGAENISARTLRREIRTKTKGLLEPGPLDDDTLESDVAALVRFYLDQGYLDVRVDREVMISPNAREAIVTFIIDEGPRHRLRSVKLFLAEGEGEPILSAEQASGLMEIKPGDIFSVDKLRKSVDAVRDAYWKMGYIDARVSQRELRAVDSPEVDLVLTVREGERFRTGEVVVQGNSITKQSVVLREVRVKPDRPLDRTALEETERRLTSSRLFRQANPSDPTPGARVTVQPEDPAAPGYRDVLIEVEETNTGSLNFGAAVSSDAGLIGTVGITERNFDVANPPGSWSELLHGEAFRGAGQTLDLALSPGTDIQTYTLTLTEPRIFETDFSLGGTIGYRTREYEDYDEDRLSGRVRLGRRFGDVWSSALVFRAENVELSDIDNNAPVDYFEAEGPDTIFGLGVTVVRTTVPFTERLAPSQGARTEIGVEQLVGDYNFTKLNLEHAVFLPLFEDVQGRRGVLTAKVQASWIPQTDEAPVYERYYLGGQSFRGFDFRGVSPRGIRADNGEVSDDPVGGDWLFFAGLQYEHPVWGVDPQSNQAVVAVVGFIDTGTVTDDPGFDDYRVSVGVGMRLRAAALGPAPLAFDFGFPLVSEDGDEERVFSFALDIPF